LELLPEASPIPEKDFPGLYGGRKRRNYEKALDELNRTGLLSKHADIRMFLKGEKDERELKPGRIPRAISPSHFPYLLKTGCYVKPIEHEIYSEVLQRLFTFFVVSKGLNYRKTGQLFEDAYAKYKNPCSIDFDVEKLDASISKEMLYFVHKIIAHCYPVHEREEIFKLFCRQYYNIVRARAPDGWLKYEVEGTLTSGQQNTSLVAVLVVCAVLYEVVIKYGLTLVNCGDDFTLIGEYSTMRHVAAIVKKRFLSVSMIVKVSPMVRNRRQVAFCQTQPLNVNGEVRCVRIPKAAVNKDSYCYDYMKTSHKQAVWCESVALGGLASHGDLPIYRSFYKCMLRNSKHHLAHLKLSPRQRIRINQFRRLKEWENNSLWGDPMSTSQTVPISDELRVEFYLAFGVTPQNQIVLENYYDTLILNFGEPLRPEFALPNPLGILFD